MLAVSTVRNIVKNLLGYGLAQVLQQRHPRCDQYKSFSGDRSVCRCWTRPSSSSGARGVTSRRFLLSYGFQLRRVQQGLDRDDWKPMQTIGPGVREIRIHIAAEHRVFYLATRAEAIYVLHAFEKTQ